MFGFSKKNLVNVIVLEGVINSSGRKSLSFKNIKENIDKAFNGKKVKAVALLINSPGGSASQSEIIAAYIKNKSLHTKVPVIALVEDVAASGGYFIAAAGKEIYALSKSSILGSIGVLYSGFGLEDFIERYSIKRRLYTSGVNKAILDPFSKEKPEDIEFIKEMLQEVHAHFKEFIHTSRKNISLPEKELFSGKFWLASKALEYGLIDGITSNYEELLKEKFGKKIKINMVKSKKGFLSSLFKIHFSKDLIAEALEGAALQSGFKTITKS